MNLLQQIVNGLAVGGVYSLVAIGWTTVWGIVGMINWTHGDVFMLGGFIGFFLSSLRMPIVLVVAVSGVASAVIATVIDRFLYSPLRRSRAANVAILITALGASTFLRNSVSLLLGPEPRTYPSVVAQGLLTLQIGGSRLVMNRIQGTILLGALFVMACLQVFLSRTLMGKAMLATAQDREAVALMGVRVESVIRAAFFMSGLLGGVAGVMIGTLYVVDPYMGALAGIKGWAAAVLGGIGSISGAMAAGLLLGIVENLTAAYMSSGWRDAIAFLIMILTLVIRPSGLMGLKVDAKV